ncbi:MAG: hypothetical protein Q8L02_04580 [Candidatus Nitrotoga sp.]|nr:hypothetical protein [Candidatus Nitrotoga sp.]
MTPAEIEQKAAEDAFLRGYHDIPDDAKLQNMSFVELAALLSSCENGSARFLVVEREVNLRKNQDAAHGLGKIENPTPKPSADIANHPHNWHDMPLGKIAIGVTTAVLGAFVIYLLINHAGIPLKP